MVWSQLAVPGDAPRLDGDVDDEDYGNMNSI